MKIIYWSDYACPYCYIGLTNLRQAIAALSPPEPILLEARAFELDPEAERTCTGSMLERFVGRYHMSWDDATRRIVGVCDLGTQAGLDLRYDEARYTNTFDAHRLTKLAQSKADPALTERLSEGLFRAFFTELRELADPAVLTDVAVAAGLDGAEVRAMLDTEDRAEQVLREEEQAKRLKIATVPYFVLDGKYAIPGAVPVPDMLRSLEVVLAENQREREGQS